ncbi:DUF3352 domain-containing protein [Kamptonema sp. UHCC 0994]|uniref:DUF3352 domain-containing protein n=1 Tax=Kamptonema sp. UHCC 0994 TaxID=3031329 RepID=UPI0023B8BA32|nr:DUF3352 domain-containing protein [Kamptonema sp. UHCC 0994]MDF0554381.1 DUF3352 domain-containing protein [Kamptonema sp. UHCC 0994]
MPVKKSQLIIIAAVVAAGSAAAFFYFKGFANKVFSPQELAQVVPPDAIMATFISPNPRALIQLQRFGSPETQTLIDKSLNDFQKQSLAGTDIDFDRDIKPWVGGVAIALLPPSETAKTDPPKLLLAVSIRNKVSAWNFANKLKAQQETKTEETEYKGVKISDVIEKSGKRYSVALLGNQLAIAPYRKTVEAAVDTFQGKINIANKQSASAILAKSAGVPNPIVTIFVADYPTLMQQLSTNLPDNTKLPSTALSQFKQIKSVVMGLGVDEQGVRLKVISQLDPLLTKKSQQQTANKLADRFPAETVALIGGKGLSKIWLQMTNEAKDSPDVAKGILQIKQGFQRLELNADREVFGWMDGEFAVGAIASKEGILSQLGMGGAMIFETSDRAQAEATLKKLDAIAGSNPSVSVAPRKIKDTEVIEWKIPQQGTVFGHGWLNQNSVFVAFGGPLIDVIIAQPPSPASSPSSFAIAKSLAQPSEGYFYWDVEKTMSWANRYVLSVQPTLLPPQTTAILNSIQGIGITTTYPDPLTAQVDALLGLKPKN